MSRKRATRFQSSIQGQRLNRAQKLTTNGADQSDQSNMPKPEPMSIVDRSVLRSGLSYDSFVRLLIQSALSRLTIWTQADLDRLLMLSERLGLDPLNNEIYATEVMPESGKKARIVYVVGVDGWSKIINSHPQFDGMRFLESAPRSDELPEYIECTIFRKDRKVATSVREYMYEAHTNQGAWLTHPRRMLRHKAMVQCARICFGLAGIYEPDEASKIVAAEKSGGTASALKQKSKMANSDQSTALFVKNWIAGSNKSGPTTNQSDNSLKMKTEKGGVT
jgi:phage recombination protein Bet